MSRACSCRIHCGSPLSMTINGPALPDASLVAGRRGVRSVRGETSRFGEICRGDRRSPAASFADPALEPATTAAPAACDIRGPEDCTKATTSRDEPATKHAARLVINAKLVPGSRLDAFIFLAGLESLWRTADPGVDLTEAVRWHDAAAGRKWPQTTSLPSFGAVERQVGEYLRKVAVWLASPQSESAGCSPHALLTSGRCGCRGSPSRRSSRRFPTGGPRARHRHCSRVAGRGLDS